MQVRFTFAYFLHRKMCSTGNSFAPVFCGEWFNIWVKKVGIEAVEGILKYPA